MGKPALCLGLALLLASPAWAQEPAQEAAQDEGVEETHMQPDEDAPQIDWSKLPDLDALTLMRDLSPSQGPHVAVPSASAKWNRTENKNGSANVALKRAWSGGIATQVGVDSVGGEPAPALPGAASAPASGAGWASAAIQDMGLIDRATLDARIDPESDQRKFGARFEKSVPLNSQFSVTLQNGYGVSQPLVKDPLTGSAHVIDSEQVAKFNLIPYGTSLFAATRQSSAEERRVNSFGAEQNLTGGISLSGSVSENAAGGLDRSLGARFKRSW